MFVQQQKKFTGLILMQNWMSLQSNLVLNSQLKKTRLEYHLCYWTAGVQHPNAKPLIPQHLLVSAFLWFFIYW